MEASTKPRRRWRRRVLIGVAVLVAALLVLLIIGPWIAGAVAPGYAQQAINTQINGKATVQRVSLSWFGGQTVGPIVIEDPSGERVANVTLTLSRGLLGLSKAALGGPMDMGTATLTGTATVIRHADGTTNLQQVFSGKPGAPKTSQPAPSPPSSQPTRLPQITGTLAMDKLDVRFLDESKRGTPAAAVRVADLSGTASLVRTTSVDAKLSGDLAYGPDLDHATAPGGSLSVTAHADSLTNASGALTVDQAQFDVDAGTKDLAVTIADALAGTGTGLAGAIGEKLQASFKAKGTLANSDATVTAASHGVNADLALATRDGVLTTPRPGTITIDTAGLPSLSPALKDKLAGGPTRFDTLPVVTATIQGVSVPLPIGNKPLDLRSAAFDIAVQSTQASGTVEVPGAGGQPAQRRPFRVAPLTARLTSGGLEKGAALKANTTATIGGESAGALAVDLAAVDLLDASGGVRRGAPGITGSAGLSGVATAIAQPFAEPLGLDLASDVGPQLDLMLRAQAAAAQGAGATSSTAGAAPGAIPPTHLTLDVKSANLNAEARLLVDQQMIRGEQQGLEVHMARVGPLATRLLKSAGVAVRSGGPVDVTIPSLVVDLDRLNRPGATGPDLRAIAANVNLQTGALAGTLTSQGQPPHAWEIAPATASLDASDLSKGVAVKAATAATFDREPAGTLNVDLRALGLVDANGARSAALPALRGRIGLTGIATAVAQPWAQSAGLDLPAGLGPKLDVALVAAPAEGDAGSAGELPPTNLDLSVRSANLTTSVPLTIDGRTIRGRGNGASVVLQSPGVLARPAAQKSGYAISDGGSLRVAVRDLAVVFDQNWSPRLDQSTANVQIATGGYSIAAIVPPAPSGPGAQPPVAPPPPISLKQLVLGAHLASAKSPAVDLQGSGTFGDAAFSATGALTLDGLFAPRPGGGVAIAPAAVRPTGKIDLNNVPTALVGMVMPGKPGGSPDAASLVRSAVGPAVTVNLTSGAPANGPAEARDVALTVRAANFNGGLDAALAPEAVALKRLEFTGQVTPELAAALIDMAGPGLAQRPNLVSPAALTITATPFTVALKNGSPDFAGAPDAKVEIGLKGTALVNNVVLKSETGPPRDIGAVGLQDVLLTADVPLSSLAAGSGPEPAQVHVTGGVLGGADRRIVDLKADGSVPIAGGAPAGDLNASATVNLLDATWVDTFLGKPGYVSGAIGQTASLDAGAVVQFPKPAPAATPREGAPGAPQPGVPAFERASLTASIKSPRLTTTAPLKATAVPSEVSLDQPMNLKWTVDPAWANANLLGGRDLAKGATLPAKFDTPLELTLAVGKLAFAMGQSGPLKPGVFEADAQVTSPGASLSVGDGSQVAPAKLKNLLAHVVGGKEPGAIGFQLSIADAGGGPAPGGKPAVSFAGGVYNVADAAGNLTSSSARITLNGHADSVPTPLIDALARQNGVIVEALGPLANLTVTTGGASEQGGTIAAAFTSARADATLKGSVHNGEFIASEPVQITLKEITPELGKRLVKSMPLVGTLEKKPEDGPATIRATNFTVPLDGNLQKLNGQVVFDLGTARFSSSNIFSQILKLAGQKQAGTVGQRLEPVPVDIKAGVASYPRVTIPLGEFRFATEGTVDLVQKRLDVVTYIPAGALSDEAAGSLNTGIGKLFGGAIPTVEQATMIPFRTSGSFEKPDTKPDMELFAKTAGKTLLRPDKLIGGSLDDLINKLKPKK